MLPSSLNSPFSLFDLKVLRKNQSNIHEGLVPSDFPLCKQLLQTSGVGGGGGGARKELVNLVNAELLVYSFSKSKKYSRYELLKVWVSYQAFWEMAMPECAMYTWVSKKEKFGQKQIAWSMYTNEEYNKERIINSTA